MKQDALDGTFDRINHFQKKHEGYLMARDFKIKLNKIVMAACTKIQIHIWNNLISSDYLRVLICKPNVTFLECAYTSSRPMAAFETKMPSEVGLLEAKYRPKH